MSTWIGVICVAPYNWTKVELAYPPLEFSREVFPSPPAETTVKLRLQLIKTKALELIDDLKVQDQLFVARTLLDG